MKISYTGVYDYNDATSFGLKSIAPVPSPNLAPIPSTDGKITRLAYLCFDQLTLQLTYGLMSVKITSKVMHNTTSLIMSCFQCFLKGWAFAVKDSIVQSSVYLLSEAGLGGDPLIRIRLE